MKQGDYEPPKLKETICSVRPFSFYTLKMYMMTSLDMTDTHFPVQHNINLFLLLNKSNNEVQVHGL